MTGRLSAGSIADYFGGKQAALIVGPPVGIQLEFPGGDDCYKIDYSCVVRKSRCVAGIGPIV